MQKNNSLLPRSIFSEKKVKKIFQPENFLHQHTFRFTKTPDTQDPHRSAGHGNVVYPIAIPDPQIKYDLIAKF
jgi:hypothetical protein